MKLLPLCTYKNYKDSLRYIYPPHVYGWEGISPNKSLILKSFKQRGNLYPYVVITKEELLRNIDGIRYFK